MGSLSYTIIFLALVVVTAVVWKMQKAARQEVVFAQICLQYFVCKQLGWSMEEIEKRLRRNFGLGSSNHNFMQPGADTSLGGGDENEDLSQQACLMVLVTIAAEVLHAKRLLPKSRREQSDVSFFEGRLLFHLSQTALNPIKHNVSAEEYARKCAEHRPDLYGELR